MAFNQAFFQSASAADPMGTYGGFLAIGEGIEYLISPKRKKEVSLRLAIARNENDLAKNLLREIPAETKIIRISGNHLTVLDYAAYAKNAEIIKYMLDNDKDLMQRHNRKKGANEDSVFEFAIESGCFDCVKVLVQGGADVNRAAPYTPLQLLLYSSYNKRFSRAETIELISYLLENGADPNIFDAIPQGYRNSVLQYAIINGDLDIVDRLLKDERVVQLITHKNLEKRTASGLMEDYLKSDSYFYSYSRSGYGTLTTAQKLQAKALSEKMKSLEAKAIRAAAEIEVKTDPISTDSSSINNPQ